MGGDSRKHTGVGEWVGHPTQVGGTQEIILGWVGVGGGGWGPSGYPGWVGGDPMGTQGGWVGTQWVPRVGGDPGKHGGWVGTQESMVGGNPRKHTGMLKGDPKKYTGVFKGDPK